MKWGLAVLVVLLGTFGLWLSWSPRKNPDRPKTSEAAVSGSSAVEQGEKGAADPSTEVLPQRHALGGRASAFDGVVVRSDNSAPVSDARVEWLALHRSDIEEAREWLNADWGRPKRASIETFSDAQGRFSFSDAPGELLFGSVLLVSHADYTPVGRDLGVDRGTTALVKLHPASTATVRVVDPMGVGAGGARVQHVAVGSIRESPMSLYKRFLRQEALTDSEGRTRFPCFEGEQVFWAELGDQASIPWQGQSPRDVVLELGESFTLRGTLVLPEWDESFAGERRILVSGLTHNLWRPLARLQGVEAGNWGPLHVPLSSVTQVSVRFEGAPFSPIEERFDRPPAGSTRQVNFEAHRGESIRFFVFDAETKTPITNAEALLWWGGSKAPEGDRQARASARMDGFIVAEGITAGAVMFLISAPGYAAFRNGWSVPSEQYLDVPLEKGGKVAGKCLHEGQPVSDFDVIYFQEGPVRFYRSKTFLGSSDGTFELDSLAEGDWSIQAASSRYPSSKPVALSLKAGLTSSVVLDLPTGIRGVGVVLDAESGEPLPNARVQTFSGGGVEKAMPWGAPVEVDAGGAFDLDAFVLGTNYLEVEAEGYSRTEVSKSTSTTELLEWGEIRLFRPQTLHVSLLGIGELEGYTLASLRANAWGVEELPKRQFESDGTIQYEGVSPGKYMFFVTYSDSHWTRMQLDLVPGKDWSFALAVGGANHVIATVVDEDGEVSAREEGVLVTAQEENGVFVLRFRSGVGPISFHGIRSEHVEVSVLDPEGNALVTEVLRLDHAYTETKLALDEKRTRIRVLTPEGAPLAGAKVTTRSRSGDYIFGADDTNADGWASQAGLPEDTILMDVQHGVAGRCFGVPIDASDDEIEFVLVAKGSLELRLVDGSVPLPNVTTQIQTSSGVSLSDMNVTDVNGLVTYQPLGEGGYHIACRSSDCWPAFVDHELGPEEHARLEVQMRRLVDLELTVLNPDGLPSSEIQVEIHSAEFEAPVSSWLQGGRVRSTTGLTTDRLGKIRIEGLPRGKYTWSVRDGDQDLAGSLELHPGEVNTVSIKPR